MVHNFLLRFTVAVQYNDVLVQFVDLDLVVLGLFLKATVQGVELQFVIFNLSFEI